MPDKAIITFTESAVQDPEDLLNYYQEQDLSHIGIRRVNRTFEDIELLVSQPDIGRIVPEFELEYLKELIRPLFRIVYRREKNNVRIIRVWRSERLLDLPE